MSFFQSFSYGQNLSAAALLLLFIFIELVLRHVKRQKVKEFKLKKESIESLEQIEDLSNEHNKQVQHIDIIRFVIIFIGIIAVLGAYNIQAFSILAVATGAFIIILKEPLASLVSFFYILSNYKSGDNIQIDNFLGEILRVKPLYTDLIGKDENGEYNGRLHHIPNFMFLGQIVNQQQLKSGDYNKISLSIYYNNENFPDNFDTWMKKIEDYLEELLPKRSILKVGHFKGYAGKKYKIDFDYNEKGEVSVKISFIAKSHKSAKIKETIIRFVESLK